MTDDRYDDTPRYVALDERRLDRELEQAEAEREALRERLDRFREWRREDGHDARCVA